MVQATLKFNEKLAEARKENASVLQTCGTKGQETWTNVDHASRKEANAKADGCSPWAYDLTQWKTDDHDVTFAMERPLEDYAISHISLKVGADVPLRGGYHIQTEVNNQVSGHAADLTLTILDTATALAFGSTLLLGAMDLI